MTSIFFSGLTIILSSIVNLSELKMLDLGDYNQIDLFEDNICNMHHLESLDLSRNNIEQIPGCIENLQNLILLDLDENQIEYIPESICQIAQNNCYIELDGNNLCEEFHFECFIDEATWDYFGMSPQDQSNCCEGPNGEPDWTQCP